jgi:hypothetical protein
VQPRWLCGLPKRRVGGPTCPNDAVEPTLRQRYFSLFHKHWVCLCELRPRRIMVAGPFIAQRAVDHHKARRLSRRENLTRRGEANHELAPAGKQLLSNKDGEGRTDDPANNSDTAAAEVEGVEFGVITRPTSERLCRPSAPQLAPSRHRVENADWGHLRSSKPLLSAVPHAAELPGRTLTAWRCAYCRGWGE